MTLAAGTRLGPYEILSAIGSGGMGEVYRARDTRLGRIVAIKQMEARHIARFEQEARAIAALNHPHICQLHDVGPDYLVLEYIEGEPPRGPLPGNEACQIAIQVVRALEAAHAEGFVHRDIKPANILVTRRKGEKADALTAKLLDFGLAKLVDAGPRAGADARTAATETRDGVIVGTVAYMSPEQAEGHAIDSRSDIFSFGAVFYEMLSGRRPFPGSTTVQVLNALLREEPPPLPVPTPLAAIVRRCLEKQPERRFQTMADVRRALEQAAQSSPWDGTADVRPSVAVLPFANLSADPENEYFSDGLAEEIINALTQVRGLKVIARTSAFAFKGQNTDIRRIAESLGVAHVLEGSVRRAGTRVRVTAQLVTATDGSHVWAERYDRELADVFAIQDEIARAIAAVLAAKLAPERVLSRRHTPPLPAYDALLRGRLELLRFRPESWKRARERFQEALALDPSYSEPHAELGAGYLVSAMHWMQPFREVVREIRAEAETALRLDPAEPAPNYLLGTLAAAHDYDWTAAGEHFRAALASTSDAPHMHWAYASFYLQPLGRFEEAIAEMGREVERDPLNVAWRGVLSSHLMNMERYDTAIENARKAVETNEKDWVPHFMLAEAFVHTGRLAEAIAEAEEAHRALPQHSMPIGLLAGALVRAGDKVRAEALLRQMGDRPLPIWGRVLYHLVCDELADAAAWYERMIDAREPFAIVFAGAPIGRELRRTTRWPELARSMNLPTATWAAHLP